MVQAHADKSKMDMSAREALEKPIDVEAVNIDTKKQIIGKTFRAKAKDIQAALEALSVEDAMNLDVRTNRSAPLHLSFLTYLLQYASAFIQQGSNIIFWYLSPYCLHDKTLLHITWTKLMVWSNLKRCPHSIMFRLIA